MLGLMQNRPLLISDLVDYVATWHAETEIVSRDPKGVMYRSNYGGIRPARSATRPERRAIPRASSTAIARPSCTRLPLAPPKLDPECIYMLLEQEGCTKAGGIPTIWLNFLAYVENNRSKLDLSKLKLKLVFSGGTAAPRATIENSAIFSASSCCTPGA